jgi:hypothetical protein
MDSSLQKALAMEVFETSTIVEDQGQVRVVGVPFEPGTRVVVTVTPTPNGPASSAGDEAGRAQRLLAALDKARNVEAIGPLRRADLYDRDILH